MNNRAAAPSSAQQSTTGIHRPVHLRGPAAQRRRGRPHPPTASTTACVPGSRPHNPLLGTHVHSDWR